MKRLVCTKPFDLRLEDVELPYREPGHALVRIQRVGISDTDMHAYQGNMPAFSYPRVLGREIAGQIVSMDTGPEELAVGDRVLVVPYLECGRCIACRQGKPNCCVHLDILGVNTDGGLQEVLALPVSHLLKADGFGLDQLALVGALAIGAHAVRRAKVQPDETVLVIGAGAVGLGAAQFARAVGARIILMDDSRERLTLAERDLGADVVLDAAADTRRALAEETGGDYPTVVVESTGKPEPLREAVHLLAHGGRLVSTAAFAGDTAVDALEFQRRETALLASCNATGQDFVRIIEMMRRGLIHTIPLVSERCALADLPRRIQEWLRPDSGVIKAMVEL